MVLEVIAVHNNGTVRIQSFINERLNIRQTFSSKLKPNCYNSQLWKRMQYTHTDTSRLLYAHSPPTSNSSGGVGSTCPLPSYKLHLIIISDITQNDGVITSDVATHDVSMYSLCKAQNTQHRIT
jgi:hypothetical protein